MQNKASGMQSPNLNIIEHLWGDLNQAVPTWQRKNSTELEASRIEERKILH